MAKAMLAAVFEKPLDLSVRMSASPMPGPGEVVLALEGTGVCASNLPLWEGAPWFKYPMDPGTGGHEGWGIVTELGEGVDPSLRNRRVAALSYKAYAERDIARADRLVVLPEELSDQPFPGEALGCAMNIFARSKVEPGQTVAILGIGFLGAILTKLASRAGARVLAISRRPYSLEIARQMGAAETIAMEDHRAIIDRVAELTQGRFCERVIEATGKSWPLDLAGELTAEGGRMMIAGYHQDGPRQINMQLWNYRGFDVINAHERDPQVSLRGMRAAVAAVTEGWFDPRPLYTHRFPLRDIAKAFEATLQRPDGFMKALVQMEPRS
ncbi:MAG: L-iditol 2-dehydrogenase [Myxococcaceae bacterium]|nr:L-iditol 2-dehydrogenase [Myxococcaceae bacterium]